MTEQIITRHDLAAILAAMTKGPWEIERVEDSYGEDEYLERGLMAPEYIGPFFVEHCAGVEQVEADAAGVAALRNRVPRVLELLEEARGAIAWAAEKHCECEDRCTGPDPNPGSVCDWHRLLAEIEGDLSMCSACGGIGYIAGTGPDGEPDGEPCQKCNHPALPGVVETVDGSE